MYLRDVLAQKHKMSSEDDGDALQVFPYRTHVYSLFYSLSNGGSGTW